MNRTCRKHKILQRLVAAFQMDKHAMLTIWNRAEQMGMCDALWNYFLIPMYDGIEFMAVECFRLRLYDRGCCNVLVNYQLLIENLKLKENSPKPPRAGKLHDDFSFFPSSCFVCIKDFHFLAELKEWKVKLCVQLDVGMRMGRMMSLFIWWTLISISLNHQL